jgi:hypothetical protein
LLPSRLCCRACSHCRPAALRRRRPRSIWSDLKELIRRSAESHALKLTTVELQQRTLALRSLIDGMVLKRLRDPAIDAQQMRSSLHVICASLLA